jgi:16S rRNA (cytosine967-C5)-methyltransferase
MTPGARLQSSIELFLKAERERFPFDVTLDGFFRSRRYVGSKDRRSISDRVWGILRRRARLDWWVERATGDGNAPSGEEGTMRARMIADAVLCDNESPDNLKTFFNGSRHCPEPLSDQELQLIDNLVGETFEHPDMPPWIRLEYPEWLHESLASVFGDDLDDHIAAMNQTAALDFRVNTLKSNRANAIQALSGEGIQANETAMSPLGIRIERRMRLGGIGPFKKGLIEVQDEGSQILAGLTDAQPGMTVVDYCAGAGGKTLAIAAQMKRKGTLIACDVSAKRLGRMGGRLKKAGIENVRLVELSSRQNPDRNLKPGSADRVFLDVPCSGTGTWRRSPDAKWRLEPKDLERYRESQGRILLKGAELVKKGGRLIYATCSLLREENEDQVINFLQNNENFVTIPVEQVWADAIGGDCPAKEPFLRLFPKDHGTDGFFLAILERKA